MKVVIINQYTENRGDEAAGTALIKNLLRNESIERIDIIYNSAYKLDFEHPRVFHRHEDLRLKNIGKKAIFQYLLLRNTFFDKYSFANNYMKKMSDTIQAADYIYVTPCGASIGIYKDWAFLIRLLFSIKESKAPIFCLNTIGASGNILFDTLAKKVLNQSHLYVREQRSKDYLDKMGLRAELGVDTAFSLSPFYEEREMNTVGMVVTLLGWHPEFKGRDMSKEVLCYIIPSVSEFCNRNGYKLELIPHIGSKEEFDYIYQVRDTLVANGLENNRIIVRTDVKTAEEYDKTISNLRMMIGMRYHSIVLAAKNSIPFVALAYENKMKEVCRYTDCEEYYIDLQKELNPKDVDELLEIVDNQIDIISNKLTVIYNAKLKNLSTLPLQELK